MKKKQFLYCQICGNIVEKVYDSGNVLTCCSKNMMELEAGVTDGKVEFHVPVCEMNGTHVTIKIGQEPHPMETDHYIEWIEVVTDKGVIRRFFRPGDKPKFEFELEADEKICTIYSYCNKHKLWKAKCNKDSDKNDK